MKTQISRNSFIPQKRYSGVYQQMGRMFTDADLNELTDLAKGQLGEALTDVIGSGTPRKRGLVHSITHHDDTVSHELRWGYVYVDGIQGQAKPVDPSLGPIFDYEQQLDFPDAPPTPSDYRLYVDLWERTVLALEDADLLDPGLNGADTCTRTQTMVQVKWCEVDADPEDENQNPPVGAARLGLVLRESSTEPDPCDPCANEIALQDKVGNYLFRLEVHDVDYDNSGSPQRLTLKWSSENGAEQYDIDDTPVGFASDRWAYEFYHGHADALASEKHLGKHLAPGFSPARGTLTAGYPQTAPSGFQWVRRWDGYCSFEKSGDDWLLVSEPNFDQGISLSTNSGADAHGHVTEGATVGINLAAMTVQLELAALPLLAGDFWYAVVRQAVHTAGSEVLPPSPPVGVYHHYLNLGLINNGRFSPHQSSICQPFEFPPLTDIRARNVCFDNDACQLPEVNTVQEALDHLCQERDLRWHNKHLHGWGIVCGLIAECCSSEGDDVENNPRDDRDREPTRESSDSRRSVCITPGYALTCDGEDIVLKNNIQVPVMEQIEQLQRDGSDILTAGRGTVCLRIDAGQNGNPTVTVEPYHSARFDKGPLDGTLLMDFFQNCIVDLIEAIQGELTFLNAEELTEEEEESGRLISQQRKKYTSLINLLVQLVNVDNGSYVFLSLKEHHILRDFYLALRELLRSKTFCAMFDENEFPEYPFPESGMTTLFGKNFHSRVALSPDNRLYSYGGTDNTINVYDLAQGRLIEILEMPSAEGAEVTAIAFSPDGRLLYATASVRGVDTVFAMARINQGHTWEESTILCDITIKNMKILLDDEGLVYAIGHGKGLYLLRPSLLFTDTKPQPEPTFEFNAVGHIEIDVNRMRAYCTANSDDDILSDTYNQIAICELAEHTESQPPNLVLPLWGFHAPPVEGSDGIALRAADNLDDVRIYVVVVDNFGNKNLRTYAHITDSSDMPMVSVGVENTQICLAYHTDEDILLLGLEDSYQLQRVSAHGRLFPDPGGANQSQARGVPVQIQPVDMVVSPEDGTVLVLNYVSNTISSVPADELDVSEEFLAALVEYRTNILLAFYSLFGNVLQYLKDCFCHHILVKCPSCDDEAIYLATVEIRDNEVYNICNFEKRKYVKSFPTIGYWLSLVPVIPMIKTAVSKFCCSIIPNLFGQYSSQVVRAPATPGWQSQTANNFVSAHNTRQVIQTGKRTNVNAVLRNQSKSTQLVAQLVGDGALNFVRQNQENQPGVKKQTLIQASTTDAVSELEKRKIHVIEVEEYDPAKASAYISDYRQTPGLIGAGSEVTLVQKNGKVVYYAVKPPQKDRGVEAISDELKNELAELEKRKAALADFSHMEGRFAQAESRRERLSETEEIMSELRALQQEKANVEAELSGIRSQFNSLRSSRETEEYKLAELAAARSTLSQEVSSLRDNLTGLDAMRKDLVRDVDKSRPVKDLGDVDVETERQLAAAGIRTLDDLANVDRARLGATANVDTNVLNRMVDRARQRLGFDR